MDMQMPVMDGVTAIKEIRERERRCGLPRIPIAMLSANTADSYREAAADSGADRFISKPFSLEAWVTASTNGS